MCVTYVRVYLTFRFFYICCVSRKIPPQFSIAAIFVLSISTYTQMISVKFKFVYVAQNHKYGSWVLQCAENTIGV